MVELLKPHFKNATDNDLHIIGKYFKVQTLNKSDFLVQSNHTCNTLSIVEKGILRIHAIYQDKEVTQWLSTPGSFVTDVKGFFFNQPSFYNIQALNQVELLSISKSDYQLLKKELPIWQEFESQFITQCFTTIENRVFSHLALNAQQRYQAYFKEYKALFNQVPLHYIASILAMTPETLSRIRNKNQNKTLI